MNNRFCACGYRPGRTDGLTSLRSLRMSSSLDRLPVRLALTRRRKRRFSQSSPPLADPPSPYDDIHTTPFLQAFADHTKPSCACLAAAPEVSSVDAGSAELSRAAHTRSRQHN